MRIDEKTYQAMPENIRAMFRKAPNPGSEEVLELFPNSGGCQPHRINSRNDKYDGWGSITNKHGEFVGYDGSGSAARFFYCAKASRAEREMGLEGIPTDDKEFRWNKAGEWTNETTKAKNHHPTVKPLALMRYLVRLVTPPNGVVLDPFTGSGTTGMACVMEGFDFMGIEKEREYMEIAEKRIAATA